MEKRGERKWKGVPGENITTKIQVVYRRGEAYIATVQDNLFRWLRSISGGRQTTTSFDIGIDIGTRDGGSWLGGRPYCRSFTRRVGFNVVLIIMLWWRKPALRLSRRLWCHMTILPGRRPLPLKIATRSFKWSRTLWQVSWRGAR